MGYMTPWAEQQSLLHILGQGLNISANTRPDFDAFF